MNNFYITTPIYYPNDIPHIGNAYTTIIADIFNRYHKLLGKETFFLTGTDEHGQKIEATAKKRGISPQAHCDEMHEKFKVAWQKLEVEPNFFMRTTYPFHINFAQESLQYLFDKGEIYPSEYEGWYSVSEETFYTEKDLIDGKSPQGKEVEKIVEKNYFFKMSSYQNKLIDYIELHPEFIQPEGKKKEVLGFLKQPLEDLCISRPKSRLTWGIELPFDKEYVTYVWFDALLNYISALKHHNNFDQFWQNTTHLVGKDILLFHAVYWPTMLMALGIPLPKTIFAHGWWLSSDLSKISKSTGNAISPEECINLVGVDGFRYFLARDIVLGNDGSFSYHNLTTRYNADLCNNLGNLVSRTLKIVVKNFDGIIPKNDTTLESSKNLMEKVIEVEKTVPKLIEDFKMSVALEEIISLFSAINKYIDELAPWKLVKEGNLQLAGECLATALAALKSGTILISPVIPSSAKKILDKLAGVNGKVIDDAVPLFPRVAVTQ